MTTSETKPFAQADAVVEPISSSSSSRIFVCPRNKTPLTSFISLEDQDGPESEDPCVVALLPLFNSSIGQLFWNNCERVWVNAARSSVVVSAFKFAEIVSSHIASTGSKLSLLFSSPQAFYMISLLISCSGAPQRCLRRARPIHRASAGPGHASAFWRQFHSVLQLFRAPCASLLPPHRRPLFY